jgi:hypothetical protein
VPICFVQAYDILQSTREFAGKHEPDYLSVHTFINDDRPCKSFTKWQQGFTPKEHRDMLDRQEFRDWQAKRELEDKQFRKDEQRSNKRYRIAELVLVVVTILAILAAAFINRNNQPTINIITSNPEDVTINQQQP